MSRNSERVVRHLRLREQNENQIFALRFAGFYSSKGMMSHGKASQKCLANCLPVKADTCDLSTSAIFIKKLWPNTSAHEHFKESI